MLKKKKKEFEQLISKIKFKEQFCIIHSDFLSFYKFGLSIKEFYKIIILKLGKDKTYIFPTFSWKQKKIGT